VRLACVAQEYSIGALQWFMTIKKNFSRLFLLVESALFSTKFFFLAGLSLLGRLALNKGCYLALIDAIRPGRP
jgi:hypothetical protein